MAAEELDIAQLIVRLGIHEGDIGKMEARLGKVNAELEESGEKAGKSFSAGFRMPLLEAAYGVQALISGVREAIGIIGVLTGITPANQFADIQLGLEQVTGSAEKARDILQKLKDLGAQTPFDAAQLASYATALVNMGTRADDVVHQVRTLADIAAYSKLPRAQMPRFMQEMQEIRGQTTPHLQQVMELIATNHVPVYKMLNAGQPGANYKDNADVMHSLKSMTGDEFYNSMIKGADAMAKGAAAAASLASPAAVVANIFENLGLIMEPTGELLQTGLTPLLGVIQDLTGWLKHLNEISGGSVGLLFIVKGLVRGYGFLRDSVQAAIRYTRELADAIRDYGAGAEWAAGRTRFAGGAASAEAKAAGRAGAYEDKAAVMGVKRLAGAAKAPEAEARGGIGGVVDWVKGQVEFMKKLTQLPKYAHSAADYAKFFKAWGANSLGRMGEAGKFLKNFEGIKALKLTKIVDVASFAGDMLLEYLGDKWRDKQGHITLGGDVVKGIGNGLGWGGMLGPWGALAGAVVGGLWGGFHDYPQDKKQWEAADKEKSNQAALDRNTRALESHGKLIGGGARARGTTSSIEREMEIARMMTA